MARRRQIVPTNLAAAVRGPKHKVKCGKTPILTPSETRELLDASDVSHVVGLRDRALIATMLHTFARLGAVVSMKVYDYFPKRSAGGCDSPRKAASIMRCPLITISSSI